MLEHTLKETLKQIKVVSVKFAVPYDHTPPRSEIEAVIIEHMVRSVVEAVAEEVKCNLTRYLEKTTYSKEYLCTYKLELYIADHLNFLTLKAAAKEATNTINILKKENARLRERAEMRCHCCEEGGLE